MEFSEKIKKIIEVTIRDDNNELYIPGGYIHWYFSEDPDVDMINEKAEKLIHMLNEAEKNNDTEFLNRDLDEVINSL